MNPMGVTSRTQQIARWVNNVLNMKDDPVGVLAWWTQGNGRIGCAPVDLLGTDREEEVLHAAAAVVEPIG